MRRLDLPRLLGRRRPGKTLATFVIALPVLLGMTGLVIDSGTMLSSHRMAQNAADAGALAAAMDLYRGSTNDNCTATATTFVQQHNGFSGVTPVVNIPPATGPFAGNGHYVEVIVTLPLTMSFIQALGATASQNVQTRAVAGYEPVGSGEGAIVLDPSAVPGIDFRGNNAQVIVNGTVVVNSRGGGVDQFGSTITTLADGTAPLSGNAVSTHQTPSIIATDIQVVGGVDTVSNFRAYDPAFNPPYDPSNTDRPVFTRAPIAPDPLLSLPTPKVGDPGFSSVVRTGSENPLQPGIYPNGLKITGDATLSPGIYVLQKDLQISGGGNVTGSGVMLYFTAGTYDPATGLPDSNDGSTQGSVNGATLSMSGNPSMTLTPINDPSSPYNGMLFYQRRQDTSSPNLTGNGTDVHLTGTIYAKWAQFNLSGQGTYQAQFVVGSLKLSGNGIVTINGTGRNFGRANQVFLVE